MNTYRVKPSDTENIGAAPRNPATMHRRPFNIRIPADKEASKLEDEQAIETVKVYTDGSSQDSKVGAAAILRREDQPTRNLCFHLGSSRHHTVHEAELIGILLGLQMIKTELRGKASYSIGVDNQAAHLTE